MIANKTPEVIETCLGKLLSHILDLALAGHFVMRFVLQ